MTTVNPVDLCNDRIAHFRSKADHNKRESLTFFTTVIVCTLSAPLFITLGDTTLLSKILPAVLSTTAAGATAWLQQRKPQQLWSLYRSAERQLEFHLQRYQLQAGECAEATNPERLLAERATEIVLRTHEGWSGLVPEAPTNTTSAKAK